VFTAVVLYALLILLIFITFFIHKFVVERRSFLVQNKLEYLKNKYASLGKKKAEVYSDRLRKNNNHSNNNKLTIFDDEKYFENSKEL